MGILRKLFANSAPLYSVIIEYTKGHTYEKLERILMYFNKKMALQIGVLKFPALFQLWVLTATSPFPNDKAKPNNDSLLGAKLPGLKPEGGASLLPSLFDQATRDLAPG